jgi:SAM-dependent methyltransferase
MNKEALTFKVNRDGEKLRLSERLLLAFCRPVNAPPLPTVTGEYTLDNALDYAKRLVPNFPERVRGKSVLDYGCGHGWQAVAMRQAGAREVHGIEIDDDRINDGRLLAESVGLTDVTFGRVPDREKYDTVISLGAMEHFYDPAAELAQLCSLAREEVIVSFAQPWYSPYGTHLDGTTRIPWLNLIFSEKTLMNVRNLYPNGSDGAKRFEDVRGGLNKMTVQRFERLVGSIPGMRIHDIRLRGVKGVPIIIRIPLVRELGTSAATCILRPQ